MVSATYRRYVAMKSGVSQAPLSHATPSVDATGGAWEHIEQSTENSAETLLVANGTNSPNYVDLLQARQSSSGSQTTVSPGDSQDNPIVLDEDMRQDHRQAAGLVGGSQDNPIVLNEDTDPNHDQQGHVGDATESRCLEATHPNAPYYIQSISSSTPEKHDEIEDEQESSTEVASPRSYLGMQEDPIALPHEPIDYNQRPIPQSSMDVSQPSTTAASHPKRPSRKRSRARPQPSPRLRGSITRPKRLCTTHTSAKATPVSFPRVQGWEVVDLVGVSVLDNGSAQCFLRWQETKINEAEIKDEHLLGQFKEKFKQKYGEAAWRRWVEKKAVRGRRYGLD